MVCLRLLALLLGFLFFSARALGPEMLEITHKHTTRRARKKGDDKMSPRRVLLLLGGVASGARARPAAIMSLLSVLGRTSSCCCCMPRAAESPPSSRMCQLSRNEETTTNIMRSFQRARLGHARVRPLTELGKGSKLASAAAAHRSRTVVGCRSRSVPFAAAVVR